MPVPNFAPCTLTELNEILAANGDCDSMFDNKWIDLDNVPGCIVGITITENNRFTYPYKAVYENGITIEPYAVTAMTVYYFQD